MVSGFQSTLYRLGQAEFREMTIIHVGILMRRVARTAFSTRPGLGVSPCSRRGWSGKIFDYCSREMEPPVGGASRNRETMYSRTDGPFAGYVK
jgi:hypothetical protein